MKKTLVTLMALIVAVMAVCTPAFASEREVTVGKVTIMTVCEDGHCVAVTLHPDGDTWGASVCDGSVETIELANVTSVKQVEGGVSIEWFGSPMTILGAQVKEIIPYSEIGVAESDLSGKLTIMSIVDDGTCVAITLSPEEDRWTASVCDGSVETFELPNVSTIIQDEYGLHLENQDPFMILGRFCEILPN